MFDDARVTQTRLQFYAPSERRGATLMSDTQSPYPDRPKFEPGPLAWEAAILIIAPYNPLGGGQVLTNLSQNRQFLISKF